MKKKLNVDLLPILAGVVAKTSYLHEDIDFYYYNNLEKTIKIINECNFDDLSFYQVLPEQYKFYYKKILAILLCENTGEDSDIVMYIKKCKTDSIFFRIILKGFKKLYQAVKKHPSNQKISPMKIIKSIPSIRNIDFEEYIDFSSIIIFLSIILDKPLDTDSGEMLSYVEFVNNYSNHRLSGIKTKELNEDTKIKVNKLYKKIISDNILNPALGDPSIEELLPSLPIEICGLDIECIKFLYKITEDDIKRLISANILAGGYNLSNEIFNCYIRNGVNIIALIKAYQECGNSLQVESYERMIQTLKNNKLTKEINVVKVDNDNLKSNCNAKDLEIMQLKLELDKRNKKISKLEQEKLDAELNLNELQSLRELMFEMECANIEYDETIKLERIENQCVIFGGHPKLIEKLKQRMINSIFVGVEQINFSLDIIKSGNPIIILTGYISHGMYYKIMNEVRECGNKLIYVNTGSNIDYMLQNIANKL